MLQQAWLLCILPWENIGGMATKEHPDDEEEVGTRQKQQMPDTQSSMSHWYFAEHITDILRTQAWQEMDRDRKLTLFLSPVENSRLFWLHMTQEKE